MTKIENHSTAAPQHHGTTTLFKIEEQLKKEN